jgi:hypothetical protein
MPERVPASAEARARILAEAGYRVPPVIKRFGEESYNEQPVAQMPEPSLNSGTPPRVDPGKAGSVAAAKDLAPTRVHAVDEALRHARDANPLIKAARADQTKNDSE